MYTSQTFLDHVHYVLYFPIKQISVPYMYTGIDFLVLLWSIRT